MASGRESKTDVSLRVLSRAYGDIILITENKYVSKFYEAS